MKVSKRDGKIVDFDITKILLAISKANDSLIKKSIRLTKKQISDIVEEIGKICEDKESEINKKSKTILNSETGEKEKVLEIEKIQDLVEDTLIKNGFTVLAKEYIKYRNERSRIRNQRSDFMAIIREKVSASNVKNQNANVDERSFGGRKGEADSEMLRTIALDERMSKTARENHLNNEIYTHDLDSYELGMHNCLSIPFDQLLEKGFTTRQVDIRPANSINTAFQLVAVIFQLQSLQQFGGCSATHLDWTMVPYVRKSFNKHYKTVKDIIWDPKSFFTGKESEAKEINIPNTTKIDDKLYKGKHFWNFIKRYTWLKAMKLTKKELKQAVEGMYHNLNSLQSRSGNQLPFTSINYGTCTLTEGRMVIKALLEGSIKGVGHGDTPIFPCGIFQYMKGVNAKKGDPNYDLKKLAIKSTTRRLYPNYANVDWSGNAGYDINDPRTYFSTMGCRTANGFDINGFGQLKDGRGNICPVTLILPTIAMRAKLNPTKENDVVESFIELLDKKIHEAKDQLIERFDWICSQSPDSAKFMWENNVMAGYDPKEGIRSAMKHGTLAIGQIGLAETLQILIGKDHTEPEGMDLAKRIEKLFADRAKEFKEEYKLNFGVYYTPKQILSGRLASNCMNKNCVKRAECNKLIRKAKLYFNKAS